MISLVLQESARLLEITLYTGDNASTTEINMLFLQLSVTQEEIVLISCQPAVTMEMNPYVMVIVQSEESSHQVLLLFTKCNIEKINK